MQWKSSEGERLTQSGAAKVGFMEEVMFKMAFERRIEVLQSHKVGGGGSR